MTNIPTKSTSLYANKEGKVVIHDLPFPNPQKGEILIKVLYSGVNLSDVRTIEFFGLRNYALGGEFCGEVLESSSLTSTPFKAGDIVAGATYCFDYHDPGVIEKVKQALQGTKGIIWGLDALGSVENPVSQEVLKSAIPPRDEVRLATVLLAPHEGFEAVLGSRQFHVEFSLPDGTTLSFPKDDALADRHWRGFRWVIDNYGGDYKPTPVRVFEGSGKDAIGELHKMWHMSNFGKVVLKHPLHQES
ncbi:hypothetical protein FOMG_08708 [Fusarium oxysporum f. sp. melonis 26406]|uniref:Alcohol dehydrogenase-like N-terminal domain-containing protein n=1 Tax=Fusarium oxysporum f. sp. melonis 26406 TaxID=1089452 RepID=X0A2E2_FUSOX|nr:hypothetical protein FOMG_08708 [Fusarium oxysporum f. sp. melonis 26406]